MSIDTLVDQAKADVAARFDKLKTDLKAIPSPTPTSNIYDDFNYNLGVFNDGQTFPNGKWKADFVSGGFAKVDAATRNMIIAPAGPDLRSVQIKSTKQWTNQRITFYVTTEKQVVTSNPAGWMSAWCLFRHIDKWRHWYIVFDLNHIEIGKKDAPTSITDQNEIEKYQYTLWTGGPTNPIGLKRHVVIEFIGNTLKVWIDGVLIKTMVDDGNLINQDGVKVKQSTWTTGSFTCYAEGSQARYSPISIETL